MRGGTATLLALALGCAGAAPHPSIAHDPSRAALVERLCAPLPPHAYDCVVGWPASIAPAHREAVTTASEGASWVSGPGVRAFASCSDRPAEDGPVAHVIVILVDTAVATPESVAEHLPVRVRWTDDCDDAAEGCASYLAHADGDLVTLTRRVQRPIGTDLDVAHLACAAVADGAVEARGMLESDDALVRELHVDEAGLAIVSRRPGGRGGTESVRRTWTELDLELLDDRVEHEADLRTAAMGRPLDPEQVDVTNETALDLQMHTRTRRVGHDSTGDELRALARLAQRGFEAHPSRPDLAVVAIDGAIRSREIETARTVLAALASTVGSDDRRVLELGMQLELVSGDADALAARLRRHAPELTEADASRMAAALVTHVADRPLARDRPFAPLYDAVLAAVRGARASLVHRASVSVPAGGVPWTLLAASGGVAGRTVVVCSDPERLTLLDELDSLTHGTVGLAVLDHCASFVMTTPSRFEIGQLSAGLMAGAAGPTRIYVEIDGTLVGVGGALRDGALRVTSASPALVRADLGRAAREVAAPLDALGLRTFPPPTLAVPLPDGRREAAIAATLGIEGVDCTRSASGVTCSLESYEPVERLGDAAFAMFAAH